MRFYVEVIRLEQIERPAPMTGAGAWFRAGSQELHVSEYAQFVPAAKAHPAFAVCDAALDTLAERLTVAGVTVQWDERLPGARRFYCHDPAGNRLEFLTRGE